MRHDPPKTSYSVFLQTDFGGSALGTKLVWLKKTEISHEIGARTSLGLEQRVKQEIISA